MGKLYISQVINAFSISGHNLIPQNKITQFRPNCSTPGPSTPGGGDLIQKVTFRDKQLLFFLYLLAYEGLRSILIIWILLLSNSMWLKFLLVSQVHTCKKCQSWMQGWITLSSSLPPSLIRYILMIFYLFSMCLLWFKQDFCIQLESR